MKRDAAETAAALLAEAWQVGTTLTELPATCRPKTVRDAMQVQDALVAALDLPVGGWKIGCSSKAAQRILKTRAPFAGRVFATRIFDSGVVLPASGYGMRGIEGEFAFVLAKNLPPRARAYTRADVRAAVGALRPAIEVVVSRFADWHQVNTASLIADLGCNGLLVLGKPVKNWRTLDLRKQAVRVTAGGKLVGEGVGADVLGDPLLALTWLANFLRRRGGLAAGEIVTTGTCSGFYRAGPNDRVEARFGKLGTVALEFSA
jgi:2-keto-4-pentenoate hydratase